MKKLLLLLLFINITACFAQDAVGLKFKAKNVKSIHQAKADVHKPKAELYAAAKKWIAGYFTAPKDMLINEEEANGIIYGKGFLFVTVDPKLPPFKMGVSMQIDCRDNHYKIRLYDILFIQHATSPTGGMPIFNVFTPADLMASLNNGSKIKALSPKTANQLLKNHSKELNLALGSFVKAMGKK